MLHDINNQLDFFLQKATFELILFFTFCFFIIIFKHFYFCYLKYFTFCL